MVKVQFMTMHDDVMLDRFLAEGDDVEVAEWLANRRGFQHMPEDDEILPPDFYVKDSEEDEDESVN